MRLEEMRREQAALALKWWSGQTRRDFCKWPRNPFGWPLDAAQLDSWWLACQENGIHPLVAVDEQGKPFGQLTAAFLPENRVHFGLILLAPSRRGQGLGTAMMLTACQWAARRQARQATVDVYACNPGALHCYQKAGFAVTGRTAAVFVFEGESWELLHLARSLEQLPKGDEDHADI